MVGFSDLLQKRLLLLEYPDIVYKHSLWKRGAVVWWAWPVAAYCNIENKEKWIVEWIRAVIYIRFSATEILYIVDKPFNAVLLPDHTEYMKLL